MPANKTPNKKAVDNDIDAKVEKDISNATRIADNHETSDINDDHDAKDKDAKDKEIVDTDNHDISIENKSKANGNSLTLAILEQSDEENIGKKINQLRLDKGLSQRKLARLAGLTNTAISSIERNKVSPAVNTLKAILQVLDSDLTTFFSDEWKERKPRVVVTPKDLLELSEPNSKVSLKQVYNCSTTKNLGFLIETYQPNSSTEEKIVHEGEEIGTVIEGKILIRIEEMTYLLNEGDSYVIDTSQPHTFINPGSTITRIVSAHTPTTY